MLAVFAIIVLKTQAIAQVDLEGNRFASTYMIVATFPMNSCRVDGSNPSTTAIASDINTFIKLVFEGENDVIIEFAKFPNTMREIVTLYNIRRNGERVYFKISKNDFNGKCVRIYETWRPYLTFGSTIIPVRIRKNPFDFSKDLTLGPTIGFKWRLDKIMPTYLNLLYSIGVTSVTVNSDNATTGNNEIIDLGALTHALGLVAETANIQFGLFWGWDQLSNGNQKKYQWVYNQNRWFSVGFGITILSNQNKARISYRINKQNLPHKQVLEFQKMNLKIEQNRASNLQ